MIDMNPVERHGRTAAGPDADAALKTGALITLAGEVGALLGGALENERQAIAGYTNDLGLAFQIVDDLLDVEGDPEILGKAIAKDVQAGKMNFVSLLGVRGPRTGCAISPHRRSSIWRPSARAPHLCCIRSTLCSIAATNSPVFGTRRQRMTTPTPLLDQIASPADLQEPLQGRAAADRGRTPGRNHRRGLGDRRSPRRRPGRGRADRRAPCRVRHAQRQAGVGRRPPGLSAQDPHRTARPHPHAAAGRRPLRFHQARRERIRPVRRRARRHLGVGGGGLSPWRATSSQKNNQRHRGGRRRRDERRHGL